VSRIRTIKPEFWIDEAVAELSVAARLLWIGTWTLADDEGILRWTPEYIKSQLFPYDADLTTKKVGALMKELEQGDLIFPYTSGRINQRLGLVIRFQKHQRINRPQPSKLPPPSVHSQKTREMYGRRDEMRCGICHEEIFEVTGTYYNPYDGPDDPDNKYYEEQAQKLSLDHIVPSSKGGSDYPSNLQAAHISCNKGKRDRYEGGRAPRQDGDDSMNDSVNDSPTVAEPFTAGREREGEREGKGIVTHVRAHDEPNNATKVATKRTRRKPQTEFPEDFTLTDDMRSWPTAMAALEAGVSLEAEFEKFKNYHIAKGNTFADWRAAFRTWLGNSVDFSRSRAKPPTTSGNRFTDLLIREAGHLSVVEASSVESREPA